MVSCSLVAISCTSVERSDTGQGNGKSGVKALRLIHMFCTWWKVFFFSAALRRNLRDQPFHFTDSFHEIEERGHPTHDGF